MQYYTTIEQSEKLVALGLNPDTADMYYFCDPTPAGNIMYPIIIIVEKHLHSRLPEYNKGDIPCWSLGALLELMPKEDKMPFEDSNPFIGYGDGLYRCVYLNGDWESSHQTIGDTSIEAAYDMVVWLLKNGYIKKGE